MKKLFKKESRLTASLLTYIFILFSLMTVIPGYPILVGSFFACLGIFYTFQTARECNDILYTALLPVKKSDVVMSKFLFVAVIQALFFVLCLVLTVVRMTVLKNAAAYTSNPLMNANLYYLGYILIIFAMYNLIFVRGFFKTGYFIGKPFILFGIAGFLIVGVAETLHHIPGLSFLNTTCFEKPLLQTMFLIISFVIYLSATAIGIKKSVKTFNSIDL